MLFDRLRRLRDALAPDAGAVPEPAVVQTGEGRFEFHWRGLPLAFDRRRNDVLRGGRPLLRRVDIRSVDVTHQRADEDDPELWKVSLATGAFASVEIGRTTDDVEASIAAARLSTALAVKVRSL